MLDLGWGWDSHLVHTCCVSFFSSIMSFIFKKQKQKQNKQNKQTKKGFV